MPRARRREHDRRWEFDNPRTRTHLLSGHDYPLHRQGPTPDDAWLRAAWQELRDELLAEWVKAKPGTRCWAWWAFDAPGPRLLLPGAPDLKFGDGLPLWFGTPSRFTHIVTDVDQLYESQTEFLRRHNLLSATEAKAAAIKQLEKIET